MYNRELIRFTQNPAVSELKEGGKFDLFNGMITGEYVSLEENKKIEMKWKMKDWIEHSHVIITLENNADV